MKEQNPEIKRYTNRIKILYFLCFILFILFSVSVILPIWCSMKLKMIVSGASILLAFMLLGVTCTLLDNIKKRNNIIRSEENAYIVTIN